MKDVGCKEKFFRNFFIGFLTLCLYWTTPLTGSYSDDTSFEASVNTNKVSLGETLQLTLTFQGGKIDSPPEIPHIDGLEVRYLGPSTSITIINGQYSSHVSHIYTVFPQKTGTLQIPAVTVKVNGKAFSSQPIAIEVVNAAVDSPGAGDDNNSAAAATSIKDRIFVTLEIPRKQVYLNEKIPLIIRLYINGLAVRDVQYPQFQHDGFTVEEFSKPRQYQQVIGGVRYEVLEFTTDIYSTRAGELKLGPATLVCNLLFKNSNRQRFPANGFDNFFEDDFFQGVFNNYQKRALSLSSVDLPIHVLTLPEEGRPPDFSGAVGTFTFDAKASPQKVGVADPVTLKMTVSGAGNLETVTMPALKADENFKLYDPQIKEENGNKILEQVVIPKSEKVREIPAIKFSYFDPEKKSYQTIDRGPFPIQVTKSENKDEFKVVGFDQNKPVSDTHGEEEFGRNIVFIKDQPGQFRRIHEYLYKKPLFISGWIALIFGWIILAVFYRRRQKLQTDVSYARALKAPKKAKKGLDSARKFMTEGKQNEFYNTIFKTLSEYLADKLHLSSAGVTIEAIDQKLKKQQNRRASGADLTNILNNVESILHECDMVRYALMKLDSHKMQENFKKLEEVIDQLERVGR